MRIVEYNGAPVRRQRKIADDQILVVFYDKNTPPTVVTPEDWDRFSNNRYYSDDVRRCEVVRSRQPEKVKNEYRNAAAGAR